MCHCSLGRGIVANNKGAVLKQSLARAACFRSSLPFADQRAPLVAGQAVGDPATTVCKGRGCQSHTVCMSGRTNHQPPTTNHQLATTIRQPTTANRQPPTINHQPPTTNRQPPTTSHQPKNCHTDTGGLLRYSRLQLERLPAPGRLAREDCQVVRDARHAVAVQVGHVPCLPLHSRQAPERGRVHRHHLDCGFDFLVVVLQVCGRQRANQCV
jgi:hypothetical protein